MSMIQTILLFSAVASTIALTSSSWVSVNDGAIREGLWKHCNAKGDITCCKEMSTILKNNCTVDKSNCKVTAHTSLVIAAFIGCLVLWGAFVLLTVYPKYRKSIISLIILGIVLLGISVSVYATQMMGAPKYLGWAYWVEVSAGSLGLISLLMLIFKRMT